MGEISRHRKRYLTGQVQQDLRRKMVFIGGPRQAGKTTLALSLVKDRSAYFNWDIEVDQDRILERELTDAPLLAFDEIHKFRRWRNYLKGLYDEPNRAFRILVTGSARLDLYRFGGDSLQGRYHFLRLHPFSVAELGLGSAADFMQLLRLSGFPEPFFTGSEIEAKRWSREYRSRLVRDDVKSLERIHDIHLIEMLMMRLPELVGRPLSINALREDLQTSHKSIASWLGILERLYAIFRLAPLGAPRIRAVKKEQKHYHFDWSLIPNDPERFENLVASHLLKYVHFEQDSKGRDLELRYFRDVEGREVDFVVVENKKPMWLIESKWNDTSVDPSLRYLKNRFPDAKAWQISAVWEKKIFQTPDGIRVSPALAFLKTLV